MTSQLAFGLHPRTHPLLRYARQTARGDACKSFRALANRCDNVAPQVLTQLGCHAQSQVSEGGSTTQPGPESIWPQHHALTGTCSMHPLPCNVESTVLGKPEQQLLQVRNAGGEC
jgi:hypothetical protein